MSDSRGLSWNMDSLLWCLRQVSLSQTLVLTKGELVPSTTTLAVLVCTAGKGCHTAIASYGSSPRVPKSAPRTFLRENSKSFANVFDQCTWIRHFVVNILRCRDPPSLLASAGCFKSLDVTRWIAQLSEAQFCKALPILADDNFQLPGADEELSSNLFGTRQTMAKIS